MKDDRAAVAWQKWVDVQLGDWRDVSHSESFYAGYEAAEDELTQLCEKLAAADRYVDIVSKCDVIGGVTEKGLVWRVEWIDDQWHLTTHFVGRETQRIINDPLEALAIIDGKDVLKEGE